MKLLGTALHRGEVWQADLDPAQGSEANKLRPVVVVSNDAANRSVESNGRGVVTVVPVTSNVSRVYPFQVTLAQDGTGLRLPSKAQAEQVRSVSATRLTRRLGRLPEATVKALDNALRMHLGL